MTTSASVPEIVRFDAGSGFTVRTSLSFPVLAHTELVIEASSQAEDDENIEYQRLAISGSSGNTYRYGHGAFSDVGPVNSADIVRVSFSRSQTSELFDIITYTTRVPLHLRIYRQTPLTQNFTFTQEELNDALDKLTRITQELHTRSGTGSVEGGGIDGTLGVDHTLSDSELTLWVTLDGVRQGVGETISLPSGGGGTTLTAAGLVTLIVSLSATQKGEVRENLDVYPKGQVYTRTEVGSAISTAIAGVPGLSAAGLVTLIDQLNNTQKGEVRTDLDVYAKGQVYTQTEVGSAISTAIDAADIPTLGNETLDEFMDVAYEGNLEDNQILQYDSSANEWKNTELGDSIRNFAIAGNSAQVEGDNIARHTINNLNLAENSVDGRTVDNGTIGQAELTQSLSTKIDDASDGVEENRARSTANDTRLDTLEPQVTAQALGLEDVKRREVHTYFYDPNGETVVSRHLPKPCPDALAFLGNVAEVGDSAGDGSFTFHLTASRNSPGLVFRGRPATIIFRDGEETVNVSGTQTKVIAELWYDRRDSSIDTRPAPTRLNMTLIDGTELQIPVGGSWSGTEDDDTLYLKNVSDSGVIGDRTSAERLQFASNDITLSMFDILKGLTHLSLTDDGGHFTAGFETTTPALVAEAGVKLEQLARDIDKTVADWTYNNGQWERTDVPDVSTRILTGTRDPRAVRETAIEIASFGTFDVFRGGINHRWVPGYDMPAGDGRSPNLVSDSPAQYTLRNSSNLAIQTSLLLETSFSTNIFTITLAHLYLKASDSSSTTRPASLVINGVLYEFFQVATGNAIYDGVATLGIRWTYRPTGAGTTIAEDGTDVLKFSDTDDGLGDYLPGPFDDIEVATITIPPVSAEVGDIYLQRDSANLNDYIQEYVREENDWAIANFDGLLTRFVLSGSVPPTEARGGRRPGRYAREETGDNTGTAVGIFVSNLSSVRETGTTGSVPYIDAPKVLSFEHGGAVRLGTVEPYDNGHLHITANILGASTDFPIAVEATVKGVATRWVRLTRTNSTESDVNITGASFTGRRQIYAFQYGKIPTATDEIANLRGVGEDPAGTPLRMTSSLEAEALNVRDGIQYSERDPLDLARELNRWESTGDGNWRILSDALASVHEIEGILGLRNPSYTIDNDVHGLLGGEERAGQSENYEVNRAGSIYRKDTGALVGQLEQPSDGGTTIARNQLFWDGLTVWNANSGRTYVASVAYGRHHTVNNSYITMAEITNTAGTLALANQNESASIPVTTDEGHFALGVRAIQGIAHGNHSNADRLTVFKLTRSTLTDPITYHTHNGSVSYPSNVPTFTAHGTFLHDTELTPQEVAWQAVNGKTVTLPGGDHFYMPVLTVEEGTYVVRKYRRRYNSDNNLTIDKDDSIVQVRGHAASIGDGRGVYVETDGSHVTTYSISEAQTRIDWVVGESIPSRLYALENGDPRTFLGEGTFDLSTLNTFYSESETPDITIPTRGYLGFSFGGNRNEFFLPVSAFDTDITNTSDYGDTTAASVSRRVAFTAPRGASSVYVLLLGMTSERKLLIASGFDAGADRTIRISSFQSVGGESSTSSGGSSRTDAEVEALARGEIADWAEDGNTDAIPVSKLTNATGLSQQQVDARVAAGVEDWAEDGNTTAIPVAKLTNAREAADIETFANQAAFDATTPGADQISFVMVV